MTNLFLESTQLTAGIASAVSTACTRLKKLQFVHDDGIDDDEAEFNLEVFGVLGDVLMPLRGLTLTEVGLGANIRAHVQRWYSGSDDPWHTQSAEVVELT